MKTKHTVVIGNSLIDLADLAYTKRYQPLTTPIESIPDDSRTGFGVGINSIKKQFVFEAIAELEEQVKFLKQVRDALADAGLLGNYFELMDGTVVLPALVESAEYGKMPNGWVVRIYSQLNAESDNKPLLTCLCSSEDECVQMLTALSERLNSTAQ